MSKKVKGQKLDLATFNGAGSGGGGLALPTAPSGVPRERGERGFGRRESYDRPAQRSEEDGDWGRAGFGGGRGGGRGGGFEEDGDGGDPWTRAGPGRRGGGGGGRDGGFGGGRGGYDSQPMARPDHMRLKLDPRSGGPAPERSNMPPPAGEPEDKWAKAFNKGGRSAPSGGFGGARSMEGGGYGGAREGGFGGAREGGFGGGRFGGRGGNDDVSDDPRFAKAFGSRRDDSNVPDKENANFPSMGSVAAAVPSANKPTSTASASSPVEDEKAKAKAAKAAAREEAERKAKEEKEAAAAKAAAEAEAAQEKAAAMKALASSAVASGSKGKDLCAHLDTMEAKPTGAALLSAVLEAQDEGTLSSLKWATDGEYGSALKKLAPSMKDQVDLCFSVQAFCHEKKFPKVTIKDKQRKLIEIVFQLFYQNDVVDGTAFLTWCDDESDDVPGKGNAIVQTTEFITFLREEDEEGGDEDEDEEEEEIDAPREIVA